MKRFKMISIVLMTFFVLSLIGCGQEEDVVKINEGEIPEKIKIFAGFSASVAQLGNDYNEVYGFQLLEEKTGCKVEWILPATGAAAREEKFSLMMASGDLPDAIVYDWYNVSGGMSSYIDNKIIIPITDLVEENMPNLTKFNEEYPEIKKEYITDDGDIIYIPFIRKDEKLKIFLGPQIRTDWLEGVGMDIPKTTDDLYNVLKAFKTYDDGNGSNLGRIPMSGVGFTTPTNGIGSLLWAFGTHYDFYVEDGKVKYGIMEPEFEEGMKYITKLFSEGLIDEDYILLDRTRLNGKMTSDQVGFMYSFQPSNIMNTMKDRDPDFKLEGISHFRGPNGKKMCFDPSYGNSIYTPSSIAITTANKNPSGTLKWLDVIFSDEGTMMMNFGKEGVTYNMIDDYPVLTDVLLNNPDGLDVSTAFNKYVGAFSSYFPMIQDWRYYEQYLSKSGIDAIETWASDVDTNGILPRISIAPEKQQTVARKMSQIQTFVEEAYDRMTIGHELVDNLPKLRKQIIDMGIEEVLEIYQESYERYLAR